MQLVAAAIPEPPAAARLAALAAASALALSRGVTSLVDMGRFPFADIDSPWRDLQEVYLPAADSGQLRIRLVAHMPLQSWPRLQAWVAARGRAHPGGRLFWGGLKEFLDGSLGSHTALMWRPYADAQPQLAQGAAGGDARADAGAAGAAAAAERVDAHPCGVRMLADSELRARLRGAIGAGLSVLFGVAALEAQTGVLKVDVGATVQKGALHLVGAHEVLSETVAPTSTLERARLRL
ncbi:hypothetical protein TSOC_006160 [Tetrabaena socialis]|uniref:Uncharacterized protein n=1 Tax=Tetrabaena socialis TaxID=47790 RepID=A0A2J8A4C7_9CHLO|nr:hypothetical protein TSOC_006160 [Tetrabaena socialis]|eukprot:PNH07380.1 hypothetical protein TSOC_006160 [Tetrabaena socialis]